MVEAQDHDRPVVERQLLYGVPELLVLVPGVGHEQAQPAIAHRRPAAVVPAAIHDRRVEVRAWIAQRVPLGEHVGERVVYEVLGAVRIADEKCRPAHLAGELASVEVSERRIGHRRPFGHCDHHLLHERRTRINTPALASPSSVKVSG